MKNKKLFISIFSFFLLLITLFMPFSFKSVNAKSFENSDVSYTLNSDIIYSSLNKNGSTWYKPNVTDTFNISNSYDNTYIQFRGMPTINFADVNTTCVIAYDFGGGVNGYTLNANNNVFNAFKLVVGADVSKYSLYICNVTDFDRLDTTYNDVLLYSGNNTTINYNYTYCYINKSANNNTLYTYNVTSVSNSISYFNYSFLVGDDTYKVTANWNSGNIWSCKVFSLIPYAQHFNINDSFSISLGADHYLNYYHDTYSISFDDVFLIKNDIIQLSQIRPTYYSFSDDDVTINQLNFLYNTLSITSFLPQWLNYSVTINTNKLYLNTLSIPLNYNVTINYSFNVEMHNLQYYGISITNGIISYITSPTNTLEKIDIYNCVDNVFLNNTDDFYFYLIFDNLNNIPSLSYSIFNAFLYYFEPYVELPQFVKGWFTFDIEPFKNTDTSFSLDIPISFTSNSVGYDSFFIVYSNDIMNYTGGQIIYNNLGNNGVTNSLSVYEYSHVPALNKWVSLSNRQIYFDGGYINYDTYLLMEKMGTFTFISNNLNNDFTLRDVFWSLAEVPILTIRKVFDFEILGTNVSNFVISIITVAIILYLLRKLF